MTTRISVALVISALSVAAVTSQTPPAGGARSSIRLVDVAAHGQFIGMLTVDPYAARILAAISTGAVFMGANTYIGNAPNFMVKAIAEENGVKMPSFFGYMAYSLGILLPLFLVVSLLFI